VLQVVLEIRSLMNLVLESQSSHTVDLLKKMVEEAYTDDLAVLKTYKVKLEGMKSLLELKDDLLYEPSYILGLIMDKLYDEINPDSLEKLYTVKMVNHYECRNLHAWKAPTDS
jgi:hypothetical protein